MSMKKSKWFVTLLSWDDHLWVVFLCHSRVFLVFRLFQRKEEEDFNTSIILSNAFHRIPSFNLIGLRLFFWFPYELKLYIGASTKNCNKTQITCQWQYTQKNEKKYIFVDVCQMKMLSTANLWMAQMKKEMEMKTKQYR